MSLAALPIYDKPVGVQGTLKDLEQLTHVTGKLARVAMNEICCFVVYVGSVGQGLLDRRCGLRDFTVAIDIATVAGPKRSAWFELHLGHIQ